MTRSALTPSAHVYAALPSLCCGLWRIGRLLALVLATALSIPATPAEAAQPAAAANATSVDGMQALRSFDAQALTWYDDTGRAGLADVRALPGSAWKPRPERSGMPKFDPGALWFRFELPPSSGLEPWILAVRQVSTDRVDLWVQDAHGRWVQQASGDTLPEASWPVHGVRPAFSLEPLASGLRTVYLRSADRHGSFISIHAQPLSEWSQSTQFTTMLMGAFLGVASIVVAWALVSARWFRDPTWLAYAAFCGALALAVASSSGVAPQFFYSTSPRLADWTVYGLFSIAAMAAVTFAAFSGELRSLSRPA